MNLPDCGWSVPERYVGSKHLVRTALWQFSFGYASPPLLPSPPCSLCSCHFLPLLDLKLEKIITLQRVASLSSRFKSTFGPASICHTFCGPNEPLPAPALQLFLYPSLSLSFVSPASTAAVPNQPKPKLKLKQRHHPKELKVRAHWQLRPSAQKIYTPIPIYIYIHIYVYIAK